MTDGVQLPRWEWNEKAGALVPMCPRCTAPARVDSTKFTCLIMGFAHLNEKVGEVLDETQRRLTEPPT